MRQAAKKYLFLGDTHGDLDFAKSAAKLARAHRAEIIQLGDWGFIFPGSPQLEALSRILVKLGVTMRFVDGNHDDHPSLKKLRGRTHSRGVTIAKNVIYQPRGSVHEDEEDTRFLFLGGAPSIDRAGRIEGESWWPEETITQAEFKRALSARGPIHVLVTHDAPAFPPDLAARGSRSYQSAQALSMKCIDALIRKHRPSRHFHGHWHVKYENRHDVGTVITGLNCNELDPEYLDESTLLWTKRGLILP
jgi:hypothetical protein